MTERGENKGGDGWRPALIRLHAQKTRNKNNQLETLLPPSDDENVSGASHHWVGGGGGWG